jgi:hypothetical protein
MGSCHCPYNNAPVTPAAQPFGIAVIGGPAVVIDIAGTRLVTDPGLDPPGDYGFIRETAGPAVPASVLGNTDIILLSHDRHRSPPNSGLPPARMAKRLFEEQPRPKGKPDDDVPHG